MERANQESAKTDVFFGYAGLSKDDLAEMTAQAVRRLYYEDAEFICEMACKLADRKGCK